MAHRKVTLMRSMYTKVNETGDTSINMFLPNYAKRRGTTDRVLFVVGADSGLTGTLPQQDELSLAIWQEDEGLLGATNIHIGTDEACYARWDGFETDDDLMYVVVT